jgi:uncharacterized protein (DUF2164 family)
MMHGRSTQLERRDAEQAVPWQTAASSCFCYRGIHRMSIEISKEARQQAIASIERYFLENRDEKIGNVSAGALLGFFVEEIGPVIYNLAVAQVQERLQMRVMEVDLEINESEFQYWRKHDTAKKKK